MKTELEWYIGDDESDGQWTPERDLPIAVHRLDPEIALPRRFRRLHLVAVLVVLALAAAVVAPVVALVNEHEAEQRGGVLELAQLEERLRVAGDVEAVGALQDSGYLGWRLWQRQTVAPLPEAIGRSNDDPAVAWPWRTIMPAGVAQTAGAQFGDVEVRGEYARVTVTRTYSTAGAGPVLVLKQEQYYRQIAGGWKRTGPPAEADGDVRQADDAQLSVSYPSRDGSLIAPLISPLAALAAQACLDMPCAPGRLALIVTADPQRLLQAPGTGAAQTVYVPAPALIGVPGGEFGQNMLYRLYGSRIVAGLLQGATSGRRITWWQPWLHWELARLELRPGLPSSTLQWAAAEAVRSGIDPLLLASAGQDAAQWLAFDFLTGREVGLPAGLLVSVGPGSTAATPLLGLTSQYEEQWWTYLRETAARADLAAPPAAAIPKTPERSGSQFTER